MCRLMWHRAIFVVVAFGDENVPFGEGFAFAFVANADFLLFMAWKCRFFYFVAWGDEGKIVSLYGYVVVRLYGCGTVNLQRRKTADPKSKLVLARTKI